MRSTLFAAAAMLIGVWGCRNPDADLPPRYRTVAVPERALAAPEARLSGRQLFVDNCALCHGEHADGRGRRHHALSTKPVDFTQQTWCRKTTPRQIFHAIREGVQGTTMPAWKALDEDQSWQLVAYLLSVCEASASSRSD